MGSAPPQTRTLRRHWLGLLTSTGIPLEEQTDGAMEAFSAWRSVRNLSAATMWDLLTPSCLQMVLRFSLKNEKVNKNEALHTSKITVPAPFVGPREKVGPSEIAWK